MCFFFFFQAEDGIRDYKVTGVQTCALPICGIAVSGDLVTAGSLQARAGGDLQMGSGASTVQVAGATTLGGKNVHQTGKLLVGGDLAIDAGEGASLGGVTAVAGSLDMRAGQGALLSGQLQVNQI